MDSSTNTVRDALGSPVFSYVANRGALLVAAVTVLTLLARPLSAAVGGGLLALSLYGGYDVLYHGLRRRAALGPLADFVARTVLLLGGVLAVPVTLTWLGLGTDLTRTLADLLAVPLGLSLLLGGSLLALEGLGLLRGRVALARAEPYVGQAVDGETVAVQGEAVPVEDADETDDPQVVTDGGQPVPPTERGRDEADTGDPEDPFAGTPFEPVSRSAESEPTGAPTEDDRFPEFASALFAAVRDGGGVAAGQDSTDDGSTPPNVTAGPDDAAVTVDASTVLDRPDHSDDRPEAEGGPPLVHVDPDAVDGDPVAVDAASGRVVVTRAECTPDAWRTAVVDWLVESFADRHGVDLTGDDAALSRLQAVAARTRTDLARRTHTEVLVPFVAEVDGATVHLRRSLVAVGPDGRPRSTPPFGDEAPVDYSRRLADRGRSAADGDPATVPGSGDTAAADTDAASARSRPDAVAAPVPGEAAERPDDPDAAGGVDSGTADVPSEADAADPTVTRDSHAATGSASGSLPSTPHGDVASLHYRRRRREKVARPRPLAWLPADPGRRLDDAVPETVPVGDRLPTAVTDRFDLPDRLSPPGVPDVFEDDDERPGARYLADDDGSSVPFRVDGFGEVRVEPAGLRLLTAPTETGADGPGLWYETRVEPGDEVALLGRAATDDDTTTLSDDGAGRFLLGSGDVEGLGADLTRGGLVRLGVGLPAAGAGYLLTTASLPGGATTLLAGGAVVGGVAAVSARRRLLAAGTGVARSVVTAGRRRLGDVVTDRAGDGSADEASLPARVADRLGTLWASLRERRR